MSGKCTMRVSMDNIPLTHGFDRDETLEFIRSCALDEIAASGFDADAEGGRVAVHILALWPADMGVVDIASVVLDALDGTAWKSGEQVRSLIVSIGDMVLGQYPYLDIWISKEDEVDDW